MSEAKLYRPYVADYRPFAFTREGKPVTVNGTPMVQSGDSIVPAQGWHATMSAALTDGAEQLEEQAAAAMAKAFQLRKEAADAMGAG